MANQQHIDKLRQGVRFWNQWRQEHPKIYPALDGADLSSFELGEADLSFATLNQAILIQTYLSRANLSFATLNRAILIQVDLSEANLYYVTFGAADLSYSIFDEADLSHATFNQANLSYANFSGTDLSYTNFSGTDLSHTSFSGANLYMTNFTKSTMLRTSMAGVDMSQAKGLETVRHQGPSIIDITTAYRSKGDISEDFLRGAGIPDSFIEYMHSLTSTPINYYSCFISYARRDEAFAKRLYADLQSNGVRCWFAPEDLKIGDHYHQRIDSSIRLYDKLILILSEHAVQSAWVEREVVAAREKEDWEKRPVLFPIRLNDAVMRTTKAWAADVRRRWHIGDFTQWKDHDAYQVAFERLLRDLKAENSIR